MSITELETRCDALRNDLKSWEKQFAAQHNGQRAGREDIKADAVISQKYKEYNKLRARSSVKTAPQTSATPAGRAQTPDNEHTSDTVPQPVYTTPMKRKRDEEETANAVVAAAEFMSPHGPSVIGPTPQRDGIVLGLFDMLPVETPSKKRTALADVQPNALQTPSKKGSETGGEASLESRARGEKTPLSAGKRFMLNQFATPKRRKMEEEGTPTSALKGLATPAFLRRHNVMDAIDETDENTPRPAPWKRMSMGKSLSAMIQDMRKKEDDRLDEEADIMRELEMEEDGVFMPRKSRPSQVLVQDSQAPMPLGPDRGLESAEDESEEDGHNGKPRKIWKKKGLKRQTRRVNMRPNLAKPKPQPEFKSVDDDSDAELPGVPETQPQQAYGSSSPRCLSDSEDASDYASDDSHTAKKRRPPPEIAEDPNTTQSKEGIVKTAARKIKATAHANYRRLKIKSKGGTGGKGRFGRK